MAELTRIPINWHINVPGKRDFTLCSGPNCRCRCNPEQASLKVAARVETFAQQHGLDATTLAGYSASMRGVLLADSDLGEAYFGWQSGPRAIGQQIHDVTVRFMKEAGITDYAVAHAKVMDKLGRERPAWAEEYLETL